MSLASLMAADVSDVFLNTSEHAETITHHAELGDASITAIVHDQRERFDKERGGYVHEIDIDIASTVTVTRQETFMIRGKRHFIANIGPGEYGLQRITTTQTRYSGIR